MTSLSRHDTYVVHLELNNLFIAHWHMYINIFLDFCGTHDAACIHQSASCPMPSLEPASDIRNNNQIMIVPVKKISLDSAAHKYV